MVISSDKYKDKGSSSMHLSVFAFEKEFHAIVSDPVINSIEAFDKVSDLSELGILGKPFADVKILVSNSSFTIVPEALFEIDSLDSYLDFALGHVDSLDVRHDHCSNFDIHIVWGIDKQLKTELIKYWPGCSIVHVLSRKLNLVNETQSKNVLFVDVFPDTVSVLLFDDHHLQLGNLFPTNTHEDALYYSLLALERANMEPKDVNAYFNTEEKVKNILQPYFPNRKEATTNINCALPITEADKISLSLL